MGDPFTPRSKREGLPASPLARDNWVIERFRVPVLSEPEENFPKQDRNDQVKGDVLQN